MMARAAFIGAWLLLASCATGGGMTTLQLSKAEACFAAANKHIGATAGLRKCNEALAEKRLSSAMRATLLVNRGIVQLNANNLAAALNDFDLAIAAAPENADAFINKGVVLLRLGGREADAINVLTTALTLDPKQPELAFYHRAIANEELGRLRAAYEDYAQAAQLAPNWPEPANQLQRFKFVRKKTLSG